MIHYLCWKEVLPILKNYNNDRINNNDSYCLLSTWHEYRLLQVNDNDKSMTWTTKGRQTHILRLGYLRSIDLLSFYQNTMCWYLPNNLYNILYPIVIAYIKVINRCLFISFNTKVLILNNRLHFSYLDFIGIILV